MSEVTVLHDGRETTIEDPEYVKALLNVQQVAIDGDIYSDVTEVTYMED